MFILLFFERDVLFESYKKKKTKMTEREKDLILQSLCTINTTSNIQCMSTADVHVNSIQNYVI